MAEPRIVLLGRDGPSGRILFNALGRGFGPPIAVLEPPLDRIALVRRRWARYGTAVVLGQVLFRVFIMRRLEASSRRRVAAILAENSLDDSPIPSEACVAVPSANSAEAIALLRLHEPPVVVVSGARVLAPEVLRSIPVPFLNLHAGITPLYRGVHGAYWALVEKDPGHCGVTLHLVDEGIDTGPILAQATIRPTPADNFVTYPFLQLASGTPLLLGAVRGILQRRPPEAVEPPRGRSAYWSHPTVLSYLRAGVP